MLLLLQVDLQPVAAAAALVVSLRRQPEHARDARVHRSHRMPVVRVGQPVPSAVGRPAPDQENMMQMNKEN